MKIVQDAKDILQQKTLVRNAGMLDVTIVFSVIALNATVCIIQENMFKIK